MSSRLLAFVFSNGMVEKQKKGEIFTISQNHDQFKSNKASFFLLSLKKNIRLGIRLVTQSKIEVATIRGKSSGIKSRFFCTTKGKEASMTPKNTSLIRCDSFLPLSSPPPQGQPDSFWPRFIFSSSSSNPVRISSQVAGLEEEEGGRPPESDAINAAMAGREGEGLVVVVGKGKSGAASRNSNNSSPRRRHHLPAALRPTEELLGGRREGNHCGGKGEEGRESTAQKAWILSPHCLFALLPPSVAPSPAKAAAAGSLREKSFWVSTKNGGGNR